MSPEPDRDSAKAIAVDGLAHEDDASFLRRLKLVKEIAYREPFPVEAVKNWAESIIIGCAGLFWLYCFVNLVTWFFQAE